MSEAATTSEWTSEATNVGSGFMLERQTSEYINTGKAAWNNASLLQNKFFDNLRRSARKYRNYYMLQNIYVS